MFNMPRIWLDYAEYAADCQKITLTRSIYDRALQTLPVTQHKIIWVSYLAWAKKLGETVSEEEDQASRSAVCNIAIDVYRRYIKLNGQAREDLIVYLLDLDRVEDALPIYEDIIALS